MWRGVLIATGAIVLGCAGSVSHADQATTKADLAKQGYVTEIDFTGATSYSVDYISEVKPLRTLDADVPHASRIYGVYSGLISDDGPDIWLFPNGRFAVTMRCDICPMSVLYHGTWHENGGVISFSPEPQAANRFLDNFRDTYTRQYGAFGDFLLFVLPTGKGIGDSVIVPKATLTQAPIDRFLVRKTVYVDWQKDLAEVEQAAAHPRDK